MHVLKDFGLVLLVICLIVFAFASTIGRRPIDAVVDEEDDD